MLSFKSFVPGALVALSLSLASCRASQPAQKPQPTRSAVTATVETAAATASPTEAPGSPPAMTEAPAARPSPAPAATTTREPAGSATPAAGEAFDSAKLGTVERDVTYCTAEGGRELKLDVYYPTENNGPWPAIVYLHGGGWSGGDKSEAAAARDLLGFNDRYLLVSVNYRLAPAAKFPAQIEDARCAVRFLRANADVFNVDGDHIGAWGPSAGGHLAALLGTAGEVPAWDTGQHLDQSSRVQAVISVAGPADLTVEFTPQAEQMGVSVFGAASRDDPVLAAASPVTYASAGDAAFLLIHGVQDATVPLDQSERLYAALQAAGVPAALVRVENAGHSLGPVNRLAPMDPNALELALTVLSFWDEHLQP